MSDVTALVESLPQHQKDAIGIIKLSLDCYNSLDGNGLFKGVERYSQLQSRVEMASTQAQSLFEFWSILLKRMMWSLPPKAADKLITSAITGKDDRAVLNTLASDTPSIISIARMLHDADKATRIALAKANKAESQVDELDTQDIGF